MRRALGTVQSAISDYAAGAMIAMVLTALARRRAKIEGWSRDSRSPSV